MAWRLHEYVRRGEIDNRQGGLVTGRIWLDGVAEPRELDLTGDCHPDLAGCQLVFENPAPIPLTTPPPVRRQSGKTGDITAARKVRVYDVPVEEAYRLRKAGGKPPEHRANSFYLEWFSAFNGRVVIESADYRLEISEPSWRFTPEELAGHARRLTEGGEEFASGFAPEDEPPWDEFRAEQLLRESDATGGRYRRLLEKYLDHPDRERLIAREMGWTWIEEALDAENEEPEEGFSGGTAAFQDEDPLEERDPALEGIDWVRDDDERFIHPTAKHVRDTFYALKEEIDSFGLPDDDELVGEFSAQIMILSVKMCAHLNFLVRGDLHDPVLLIAWLKRDLDIHNQALAGGAALEGHPGFPASRLAHYRAELFQIREAILAIISRLRKDI